MKELKIRIGSDDDLNLLAVMNQQLIEDEGHDNLMDLEQLLDRMRDFIRSDYRAYLFENRNQVLGYALINHHREPLYLRHFFMGRDVRRQGYGTVAFKQLLEFIGAKTIDIEVLVWNEGGVGFWKSLGFKERSIYMRLDET